MQKVRYHRPEPALPACKRSVSMSISLPLLGSFHLSLTVLFSIGHWLVLRLGEWSPHLLTGLLEPRHTQFILEALLLRGYHPLSLIFPDHSDSLRLTTRPYPISLATTFGVSFDFLSYRYLDVSVPCVRLAQLFYSLRDTFR